MAQNEAVVKNNSKVTVKGKKESILGKIDNKVMVGISLVLGLIIWYILSLVPSIGIILVGPNKVFIAAIEELQSGRLLDNIGISLFRVLSGYVLAFFVALPIAFLMGWYSIIKSLVEPWIQFFRTIPPIAMIPLVIVAMGIGEGAKIAIIFFCSFLVMVISIYQGVCSVDTTIIKAARVLGAKEHNIFFDIVVPASFPYILIALRLGISTAMTTLVAAELTGASKGLGNMIQEAGLYFQMDIIIMGILTIGIIGFAFDKLILFAERKLTSWQDTGRS